MFLDRDGVINRKPADGEYIRSWEDFELIPSVVDWILLFNSLGLLVIVVTNQRGIARGLMQQTDLTEIHDRMIMELNRRGAHIDDIFCCPHEENTCDCRKPKPGLVHQACQKWDVDISRSVLIGDSDADRQLAESCGLRFIHTREGRITAVCGSPVG